MSRHSVCIQICPSCHNQTSPSPDHFIISNSELLHCLELNYPQTEPNVKQDLSTLSVLPKRLKAGVTENYRKFGYCGKTFIESSKDISKG